MFQLIFFISEYTNGASFGAGDQRGILALVFGHALVEAVARTGDVLPCVVLCCAALSCAVFCRAMQCIVDRDTVQTFPSASQYYEQRCRTPSTSLHCVPHTMRHGSWQIPIDRN